MDDWTATTLDGDVAHSGFDGGKTVVGYFYGAQDARRAHNHLRCEFETLTFEPYAYPSGAGPRWCVRVLVPEHGPWLHGADAVKDISSVVSRWNGVMELPRVTVLAHQGDGVYVIDVGNGMGQVAATRGRVLLPPRRLPSIMSRGCWEACGDVLAEDVIRTFQTSDDSP